MIPTCQEVTELVTDYLLGKLPTGARLRFQLHLGLCRNCRRYLRQLRASIRATGALPKTAMPPDVLAELTRRFEGWKG